MEIVNYIDDNKPRRIFEYTIDRKFANESIISIKSWQSNKYFRQPSSIDLRIII